MRIFLFKARRRKQVRVLVSQGDLVIDFIASRQLVEDKTALETLCAYKLDCALKSESHA